MKFGREGRINELDRMAAEEAGSHILKSGNG